MRLGRWWACHVPPPATAEGPVSPRAPAMWLRCSPRPVLQGYYRPEGPRGWWSPCFWSGDCSEQDLITGRIVCRQRTGFIRGLGPGRHLVLVWILLEANPKTKSIFGKSFQESLRKRGSDAETGGNGKRIKGAVMGGLQLWAAGAQAPWGFSGRSCGRIAELSPCEDEAAGALTHQLLSVQGTDSQPVQPATHLGAEAGSQLPCRSPLKAASGAGPGVNGVLQRPLLHAHPP